MFCFKKRFSIALLIIFVLSVMLTGCGAGEKITPSASVEKKGYAHPEMLIDVQDLQDLLDKENVRILDVRSPAKYILGHIPGAVNIWRPDYEAPEDKYGFGGMLCDKTQWEQLMGKLGISNKTRVIIYDDKGLYDGARVWWALYGYGHKNMQVLDGGLDYWKATGGETTVAQPEIKPATYKAKDFNQDIYGTLAEIKAALKDDQAVVLDTRAEDEYTGEKLKKGAFRKGRIPDAPWLEWSNGLNEDETIKSAADLKAMFKEFGIEKDTPVFSYCQSGVRSASTWFQLRLIGYEKAQNYDGSWIEWSYNEDLPLETDK